SSRSLAQTAARHQSSLFLSPPTPPPHIYTLSLHDALPISSMTESSPAPATPSIDFLRAAAAQQGVSVSDEDLEGVLGFLEEPERSEEHTSELQSRSDLVCRLLLEKKNSKTCP